MSNSNHHSKLRKPLLVRVTTIPASMRILLKGQIRYMASQGFDCLMISSNGPDKEKTEYQEGVPMLSVPFTRSITPIQDLRCLFQLIRIFRKYSPDIVHAHTPKAGLISMWAAWWARVPIRLHTVAGLPWMEKRGLLRFILKWMEKMTALPATAVFPNSRSLLQFLEEQGIARHKLKLLGNGTSNGIDLDHFCLTDEWKEAGISLRQKMQVSPGSWVWIFIGRVVKDKGIGEMLTAFQALKKRYPEDQLWILGEEEPELDPLTGDQKLLLSTIPGIRCMGFQEDVRPYLSGADVLLFPSYREGFPNVPMQAGRMGCALILSNINGCNELVEDGLNGILVNPKDTQDLMEAMQRLRQDDSLKEKFSRDINLKIETYFGRELIWSRLLSEYVFHLRKRNLPLPHHEKK